MIYIIDTETTGLTPKDQVIELATIEIPELLAEYYDNNLIRQFVDNTYPMEFIYNERFMCSVPINPHAQKVHGISKLALLGKRHTIHAKLHPNTKLIIGHNVSFDKRMLAVDHNSICTMNLAKKIEKIRANKFGFDNYKLYTMFCFFYPELAEQFRTTQHNALVDCRMTLLVLIKLIQAFPFLTTLYDVHEYFFAEE